MTQAVVQKKQTHDQISKAITLVEEVRDYVATEGHYLGGAIETYANHAANNLRQLWLLLTDPGDAEARWKAKQAADAAHEQEGIRGTRAAFPYVSGEDAPQEATAQQEAYAPPEEPVPVVVEPAPSSEESPSPLEAADKATKKK